VLLLFLFLFLLKLKAKLPLVYLFVTLLNYFMFLSFEPGMIKNNKANKYK
jgi:hypothetical protein